MSCSTLTKRTESITRVSLTDNFLWTCKWTKLSMPLNKSDKENKKRYIRSWNRKHKLQKINLRSWEMNENETLKLNKCTTTVLWCKISHATKMTLVERWKCGMDLVRIYETMTRDRRGWWRRTWCGRQRHTWFDLISDSRWSIERGLEVN